MEKTTQNKQVAVVIGAASGIGKVTAQALANKGVKVALMDRDAKGLEAVLASLNSEDSKAYVVDIVSEKEVKKAIEDIKGHFGRIDILINSAGITGETNKKSHETNLENIR